MSAASLRAPFPWFGGKARAVDLIWPRFGPVSNYVEPFFGGGAVLLGRPAEFPPRVETVNDKDAYLANFWRAVQGDPDGVTRHCDWPVNETDLHARHQWLVESGAERLQQLRTDPDYFDVKVAGWWVYGQCLWIGSGWCAPRGRRGGKAYLKARVKAGRAARGVNSDRVNVWRKRPGLSGHGQGNGINRTTMVEHADPLEVPFAARAAELTAHKRPDVARQGGKGVHRRWNAGGRGGGSGVHAPRLVREQIPQLSGDGSGAQRGLLSENFQLQSGGLLAYIRDLSARLRRVRVCCGEWHRVLTPAVTSYIGVTAVLLDPPYSHAKRAICYAQDSEPEISTAVRAWAIAHGDDPKCRIALCGYEDEHDAAMPASWTRRSWKAGGGYSRTGRARENRHEERIWFSPHCLEADDGLPLLREA